MPTTAVLLERGRTKVFASAVDWPGWSRSARTPEAALSSLAEYGARYAPVAQAAGVRWPTGVADSLKVVEEVPGNGNTDYGVPALAGESLSASITPRRLVRLVSLVRGAWAVLDAVVEVSSESMRKGPRGGGRDRTPMLQHVLAAEAAYARKVGVKVAVPDAGDPAAIHAARDVVSAALEGASASVRGGDPFLPKGWPVRYAAHRIAWHVLDHAWEMQDKSEPA